MEKMYKKSSGFTLLELMVTVVVIAILSAIAIPSYQDSVRKSRRSDAHSALSTILLQQENYRMTHTTYASAFGTATNDVKAQTSDYYTFSISGASASAYTITATAKSGTSQASDSGCTTITINQAGTKSPAACWK